MKRGDLPFDVVFRSRKAQRFVGQFSRLTWLGLYERSGVLGELDGFPRRGSCHMLVFRIRCRGRILVQSQEQARQER